MTGPIVGYLMMAALMVVGMGFTIAVIAADYGWLRASACVVGVAATFAWVGASIALIDGWTP